MICFICCSYIHWKNVWPSSYKNSILLTYLNFTGKMAGDLRVSSVQQAERNPCFLSSSWWRAQSFWHDRGGLQSPGLISRIEVIDLVQEILAVFLAPGGEHIPFDMTEVDPGLSEYKSRTRTYFQICIGWITDHQRNNVPKWWTEIANDIGFWGHYFWSFLPTL